MERTKIWNVQLDWKLYLMLDMCSDKLWALQLVMTRKSLSNCQFR
jgi:hypothetical protein